LPCATPSWPTRWPGQRSPATKQNTPSSGVAHNLGYHQSVAHYQDGVEQVTGERLPFAFVLVEKEPPYLVSVVELDPEAVELGRRLNTKAKNTYRECLATNQWPGYESTEPIRLPAWAARNTEEELTA
jgi:hypothetical protein